MDRSPLPIDAIILGHGLAGATLAWHLRWRGWRVLVIDRDESVTSSKVAAGIVTPITGQRVARSWRIDEFLPEARSFYDRVAAELGTAHYRSVPYVRLLHTGDECRRWKEKKHDPAFQRLLTNPQPHPLVDPDQFLTSGEGFEMQGAWLDVKAWLMASREHLQQHGAWLTADVPADAVAVEAEGVTVRAPEPLGARHLVFCQGFEAAGNPFFPWLRWKSAKGEILTVHAPELRERRIVNSGGWLLPLGCGGLFRAGSTYSWNDLDSIPTASARAEIESRLERLLRVPFTVTGHDAGVRPIINESKALIGLHPVHRRLGFFNGLGSKGVLHAPFFAAQLAALLVDGTAPEYEVDVCRN
jgi:glycine/D-amino acid oxidase-like deaminating enzyme